MLAQAIVVLCGNHFALDLGEPEESVFQQPPLEILRMEDHNAGKHCPKVSTFWRFFWVPACLCSGPGLSSGHCLVLGIVGLVLTHLPFFSLREGGHLLCFAASSYQRTRLLLNSQLSSSPAWRSSYSFWQDLPEWLGNKKEAKLC